MADLIRHLLKESVTLLLRRLTRFASSNRDLRVFARNDSIERSILEIKG